ncbi:AAA family ATPase [Permianibacter sp. IMCC34836]|uniref:TniB family NTP-binding protein n=1 Tax=Permianibacter fluminis TaxID=2738515 RepID=UPI0015574C6C|nr:TniB family NTP-binding protein [Permianibacter fluminis]NQD36006.1 AAA family ATPase [Permianibacter fluminis]
MSSVNCYKHIEAAVSHTPVLHRGFARALDTLEMIYQSNGTLNATLCGESGTGKSTLCRIFRQNHPISNGPEGDEIPVVCATLPSRPTAKSVARNVIGAMGAVVLGRPDQDQLTKQLRTLLQGCKTKVIVLDEFQHFIDRRGQDAVAEMGDWLKVLLEDLPVSLVLVGLPRTGLIRQSNEQFRRRFNLDHVIKPFSVETATDQQEFFRYLRKLEAMLPFEQTQRISTENLLLPLWFASNGLIDYLNKVVGLAGDIALENGADFISREHLELSFQRYVWPGAKNEDNPFHPDFRMRALVGVYEPFAPVNVAHVTRRAA